MYIDVYIYSPKKKMLFRLKMLSNLFYELQGKKKIIICLPLLVSASSAPQPPSGQLLIPLRRNHQDSLCPILSNTCW